MKPAFHFGPEMVLPSLAVTGKKAALREMASLAIDYVRLDEKEIFAGLMEREHQACTGLGYGVCVPHARFAELAEPCAVFARLVRPIEFGAADGHPVDLLFLVLTPQNDDKKHMNAIASASRVLRDKALCAKLREVNGAQIYPLLSEAL